MTNPLVQLKAAGQSVWLDFVQRSILENGDFKRLVDEDGLSGVTSNPSIFEKAIGESGDYDAALKAFVTKTDADPAAVFDHLAIADIQAAADLLRPTYEATHGKDGFVSLEVSPYKANDTQASIDEARALWRAVERSNLMIKIPGTPAGVPAIRELIGEGLNVNVTLLFSIEAYRAVAEAHLAGLEARHAAGDDIAKVAGVASFFVSRIDSQIDAAIDARLKAGAGPDEADLKRVRGQVAVANAKMAYQDYLAMLETPRWKALAAAGAQPQRLLWASTGTKNPDYSDVLYIETLIGPDTVNTMPPKTMDAFRDHGVVRETLTADIDAAKDVMATAETLGLDLGGVTAKLVEEGVRQFADAADKLYGAVADKRTAALGEAVDGQTISVPDALTAPLKAATEKARAEGWARRLWAGDAGLWTGGEEAKWLGWLAAGQGERIELAHLETFQGEIKAAGFTHALLLGMGGSSLGPEVLGAVFGHKRGYPELLVLDSTDPTQIARYAAMIDPARTLFIVASKSGTTLEPDILERYFFDLATKAVGEASVGSQFVAITDPGSQLESRAADLRFRRIFLGDPQIGGRYSALSNFGMVPAAVAGVDVRAFMAATQGMVRSCAASAPPAANPGVALGLLLGAAAVAGRDKLTVVASTSLVDVGAWLEQLVAESTGKNGKGIVPVAGEPLGAPDVYGDDRVFAQLTLAGETDARQDAALEALQAARHPVVRIAVTDRKHLGQEFFRWEVATAIAGAVIGIDPFDQPDVEASKIKTKALTSAYEQSGELTPETAILEEAGLALYADAANAAQLAECADGATLEAFIAAHFGRAEAGDYIGLLAYIDRDPAHEETLTRIRAGLRDRRKTATVVGFGPRFLHSTGQAYKGGPNSGVFLQIGATAAKDLQVPGRKYSFGVVEPAQALGDLQVLAERGRRHLRIDLGSDVAGGLKRIEAAVERVVRR